MILIGLGANLPGQRGSPLETLRAALGALDRGRTRVLRRSGWYRSPAYPPSDQPWFVNAVAALETALDPSDLMARLHTVEREFGRFRSVRNAARVLDLDLIDYGGLLRESSPSLPHPRIEGRAFVLLPLAEVAPDWRHPATGEPIAAMLARLPPGHRTERIAIP